MARAMKVNGIDDFLALLDGVQETPDGWSACCPAHDDGNPSLTVKVGDGDKILIRCHSAGCSAEEIVESMGLTMQDLFPRGDTKVKRTISNSNTLSSVNNGQLTLKALASAKGFDVSYLEELGVQQRNGYVVIEYRLEDGALAPRSRIRKALTAKEGSSWGGNRADSIVPYGLWRLDYARKDGCLIAVEGESDAWTLWLHGIPTLGIPSATQAKTLKAEHIKGIREFYVFREPDEGGDKFVQGITDQLRLLDFEGEVFEVRLVGVKDPNDLHTRDPKKFKATFKAAMKKAKTIDLQEWPELHQMEDGDVKDFPIDVFPTELQEFISCVSRSMCCPPDLVAVPMLIIAGAVIGNSRRVVVKDGWLEAPSLYGGCVGRPGTAKSPAMQAAMAPVLAIHERLTATWEEEMAEYREYLAWWESADAQGRGPKPDPPLLSRVYTSDTTVEALAVTLSENPRGILVYRDELAGWARSMDAYKVSKGADRQFWLSCWSSEAVVVDRKGNSGPVTINRPFLSVLGSICPDMLKELLDSKDRSDGSIERLLLSFPSTYPEKKWTDEGIPEMVSRKWLSAVEHLFGLEPADGKQVTLTKTAKKVFAHWFDKNADEEEDASLLSSLRNAWAKMPAHCARFALIVQQLRRACGEASSENIDDVSMRKAIKLVDYFKSHAVRIHHRIGNRMSELGEDAKAIIRWTKKHDYDKFNTHKLWEHLRNRFGDQENMNKALKELVKQELIRLSPVSRKKRGRKPSPTYEIHPDLL